MKKVLVILSFMLVSLNAQAILLTDLLNGQSIVAGDKLFADWGIIYEDKSDFTSVNTDNIEVTSLNDGGLDPGPGLHFDILNDEFRVDGDGIYAYLDFWFGFSVTVLDDALLLKDNSLYLTGATLGNAQDLTSVFIEETIYGDDTMDEWLGVKDVEFSILVDDQGNQTQTAKLFDSADFAPTKSIYVTKNILVEAVMDGEFARLSSFEQRFSQQHKVPEPSSLLILSLGLIGLRFRKILE